MKIPHATEQLSLRATPAEPVLWSLGITTTEPCATLLKPACPKAYVLEQDKPPQWESHTLQLQTSPTSPQQQKSLHSNEDAAKPKNI